MQNKETRTSRLTLVQRDAAQNAAQPTTGRSGEGFTQIGSHLFMQPPTAPPPANVLWTCVNPDSPRGPQGCGPIEPLAMPTGRWIKRSCACERLARQQQQDAEVRAAWLTHQAYRTYGGWLGERWVEDDTVKEMKRKTFASYDASLFPVAVKQAQAFARDPKGNLILHGTYGVGKTHLEAAIINYLREEKHVTCLFVSALQFFLAYNDAATQFDKTRQLSLMQQIIETPVLVLDDVDKIKPTETRLEMYWLIFDARYKAKRPTVLSTNKITELGEYIGEAAVSRLQRGQVSVKMVGTDFRTEEE